MGHQQEMKLKWREGYPYKNLIEINATPGPDRSALIKKLFNRRCDQFALVIGISTCPLMKALYQELSPEIVILDNLSPALMSNLRTRRNPGYKPWWRSGEKVSNYVTSVLILTDQHNQHLQQYFYSRISINCGGEVWVIVPHNSLPTQWFQRTHCITQNEVTKQVTISTGVAKTGESGEIISLGCQEE